MMRIPASVILSTVLPLFCALSSASGAEKVVLGFGPSLTSALDVIADSQGFFAAEGLQAEMREYSRGSMALEALLRGEVDISSSTGFALASAASLHPELRVVATVATAGNDNQIVARRGRGIAALSDLRGKKVGVVRGGMSQYVLDLLLLQGGLMAGDVTITHDEPARLVERFKSGELDAVCTFGAWMEQARAAAGADAVIFTDESLVRITTFMTATKAGIVKRPDVFTRVVKAYIRAEEYIHANPEKALEIVARRFKLDLEGSRKLWKPNLFRVALDQSLLEDLDNLARWQRENAQASGEPPNFLGFIWLDTLKAIDPRRVTIIH